MAHLTSSLETFPVVDGINQVIGLSLVLTVLFITGRSAANIRLHRKLFLDDYAAIAGFAFFVTFTGLCLGIDHYARYVQNEDGWDATAPYYQKIVYAAEIIGPPASLTAKSSVLLLYLRIFNPSKPLRRGVTSLFAFTCIVFFPSLPLFSFYCAPNASDTSWDDGIAQNCMKVNSWTVFLQCVDVLINIAILILPMPSIFRLQLSIKRRLLLAFVLMHGVFALAASIAGAAYRANLARTIDTGAALWFRSAAFVCFEVELGMTLVSGSFHACWGYIRFVATQRASRSATSRRGYYYGDSHSGDQSSRPGEKMPASPETGLSERAEDGLRSRSEFSYPEAVPNMSSATALNHAPATTGPRSMLPASPALQPGVQSHDHLQLSPPVKALPTLPTDDSVSSASSTPVPTPTATRFEDLQYSPAPSSSLLQPSKAFGEPSEIGEEEEETEAEATHAAEPPHPRIVPSGRLMAEIEEAVAAAGKARLVVGRTRLGSGVSFDGVDVRRVVPLSWTLQAQAYPLPASRVDEPGNANHHHHRPRRHRGHREYMVEKVGEEYVVEKAGEDHMVEQEPYLAWNWVRDDEHAEP